MAIQEYINYLGKEVSFTIPLGFLCDSLCSSVSGTVTAVCIEQDLHRSSFVVNDVFYRFSEVKFYDSI